MILLPHGTAVAASLQHRRESVAPVEVDVRAVTKSFPQRRTTSAIFRRPFAADRATVLHDVSFQVRRGELFGILGLNGAGKTTLLKILSGIIPLDGGSVTMAGIDVVASPRDVARVLAVVTADERALNWRLSAAENLRLYAGLHRLDQRRARQRIAAVLEAVGLPEAGSKLVGAFSSGMRQRLLVACGLLAQPRILLLDEPTRSLDPVSAHAFRVMLAEDLVRQHDCTIVIATHNTEEAFTYCDRVAVLHRGVVAAEGGAASLAARFVPDRYHVATPMPAHPAFDTLTQEGWIVRDQDSGTRGDASGTTCAIPGGAAGAERVLRYLVQSGVPVSRFEHRSVSLAALIQHVVTAPRQQLPGTGEADA